MQKALPIEGRSIRNAIRECLSFLKISCKELAVYFVSEQRICSLHTQFFNDATPTDCISFPIDQEYLGEIFICPKAAIAYAKKRHIDPQKEVLLYLIHGILHLIGYDDQCPTDRKAMRKMEKRCLEHLSFKLKNRY